MIYLRKAVLTDLSKIINIIEEARIFLGKSGSDQWQDGYPEQSNITDDIAKGQGYILVVDDEVAAYSAIITGEEPAYTKITDGAWSNDNKDYVTVHRIAFSDNFRGHALTKFLFSNIFTLMNARGYQDFRVDTHEMNAIMQHVFEREGFVKRGIVVFDGVRLAYQREL
ncbi:GNAT family N-acetyltransferase [Lactococcus nasutitermitis]|uniref:GNAT family N-acetyltransferase n=1 Tax=Lactococcus nasutitermitis TaxID=1652957 RepID=A0ABV9JII1_9LACT|nr:GNAT family N-acetyltransferase [Lactococcus nasutitermitis]